MIRLEEIKNIILSKKADFEKNYHVKSIGIFGSYVRMEQTLNSDLDILVDFSEPIDFFLFLDLEEELEKLCNIKVDLVSKKALKPHIGKQILQEVQYL